MQINNNISAYSLLISVFFNSYNTTCLEYSSLLAHDAMLTGKEEYLLTFPNMRRAVQELFTSHKTFIFLNTAVITSLLSELFLLTNSIRNFTIQHNMHLIQAVLSGGRN
jgi:hypothetical protein